MRWLPLVLVVAGCAPGLNRGSDSGGLTIATWNMEHLAEADGAGCRPRQNADYLAMRAYAEQLQADVVAIEEVESVRAAERVFDPEQWVVLVEERMGSGRRGECGGARGGTLTAQKTGFAVRRGVRLTRNPDVTSLQVGNADLRSGVDITVQPRRGAPLRLLSVHLKSGCSSGASGAACETLQRQIPELESWIDARAAESIPFAVLGDFNRRLSAANDAAWAEIDDGDPANADLTLAAGQAFAGCDPRYSAFIDHIVLDRRASERRREFTEHTYAGPKLSDHCAVSVRLQP